VLQEGQLLVGGGKRGEVGGAQRGQRVAQRLAKLVVLPLIAQLGLQGKLGGKDSAAKVGNA
jgi:hypothetical protein